MTEEKCPHPRKMVHQDELISRFIFDEKHLRNKSQAAFSVSTKTMEFSTYRVTKLTDLAVWGIGHAYVGQKMSPPKEAVGRADLTAAIYYEENLHFAPNGKPHTRHANVLGWNPSKPDDLERRMSLARSANWLTKA